MGRRPDVWDEKHKVVAAHNEYVLAWDAYLTARGEYIEARKEKDQATVQRDSVWFSRSELKVVSTWDILDQATKRMRDSFKALRHEQSEMNSRGHWG